MMPPLLGHLCRVHISGPPSEQETPELVHWQVGSAFFIEAHEKINIFLQLSQPLCRSQSPEFCHPVTSQEWLNRENATSYFSIISSPSAYKPTVWLHGGRTGLPPDGLSWMLWNEMRCPCLRVIFSTSGLELVKQFLLNIWSHASFVLYAILWEMNFLYQMAVVHLLCSRQYVMCWVHRSQ